MIINRTNLHYFLRNKLFVNKDFNNLFSSFIQDCKLYYNI